MIKAEAVFSILMGATMLGTWLFLFLSNRFPQARTLPVETGYLLVAEFLTAAALIVAGYGILSNRGWGTALGLVALGQLIYCTVRFAGELGQGGSSGGLIFFTTVGVFGILFAGYLVFFSSQPK